MMSCRLVVLNLPAGSEFFFDCWSWTIGENFRGLKCFSTGLHFLAVSAASSPVLTHSCLHVFNDPTPLVLKWDTNSESLTFGSEDDVLRIKENLTEVDRHLGKHQPERDRRWLSLTHKIQPTSLKRLMPDCGFIFSAPQLESVGSNSWQRLQGSSGHEVSKDGLPKMVESESSRLHFTPVPRRCYPENCSAAEVTRHSMDSSYLLEQLLAETDRFGPNGLLSEMQFSFVVFLFGRNLDAFEHWKKLVHVFTSCDEALSTHDELFRNFIGVLYFQVQEVPEDFFHDLVTKENFLVDAFKVLFDTVGQSTDVSDSLRCRVDNFRKFLTDRFKWSFDFVRDEDLPVVVS